MPKYIVNIKKKQYYVLKLNISLWNRYAQKCSFSTQDCPMRDQHACINHSVNYPSFLSSSLAMNIFHQVDQRAFPMTGKRVYSCIHKKNVFVILLRKSNNNSYTHLFHLSELSTFELILKSSLLVKFFKQNNRINKFLSNFSLNNLSID